MFNVMWHRTLLPICSWRHFNADNFAISSRRTCRAVARAGTVYFRHADCFPIFYVGQKLERSLRPTGLPTRNSYRRGLRQKQISVRAALDEKLPLGCINAQLGN